MPGRDNTKESLFEHVVNTIMYDSRKHDLNRNEVDDINNMSQYELLRYISDYLESERT